MGWDIIEGDTDGFFVDYKNTQVNPKLIEDLNNFIKEEVSQWGLNAEMVMEDELYEVGFWYRMKNYILRDKKGKIKIVGSGFKGSGRCKLTDKFRDEICKLVLDNAPIEEKIECVKRYMRIDQFPIQDLIKSIKITKRPSEYTTNTLGKKLALKALKELKVQPLPHTQYEFVEGVNGPMLAARVDEKNIDYFKYRQMIVDVAKLFGLEKQVEKYVKRPNIIELKQEIW